MSIETLKHEARRLVRRFQDGREPPVVHAALPSAGYEMKVYAAPAQPEFRARDLETGLDFLRPPDAEGHGAERFREMRRSQSDLASSPDLQDRIRSTSWYHTIDLGSGITTPGFYDHRELLPYYCLPSTLAGLRTLDVATFDGFWAFEMERRGAEVVALDLNNTMQLDLQDVIRRRAIDQDLGVEIGCGFRIAAAALDSKVERREGSVYDLDAGSWGKFDFVHMADLLLHLERPWEALRRVREVVDGTLHLCEPFDPTLRGEQVRYLGGWQDIEWWLPSLQTLCQWVTDAGFENVRVQRTFSLSSTHAPGGFRRAILQATS